MQPQFDVHTMPSQFNIHLLSTINKAYNYYFRYPILQRKTKRKRERESLTETKKGEVSPKCLQHFLCLKERLLLLRERVYCYCVLFIVKRSCNHFAITRFFYNLFVVLLINFSYFSHLYLSRNFCASYNYFPKKNRGLSPFEKVQIYPHLQIWHRPPQYFINVEH